MLNIRLPEAVLNFTGTVGAANGFLAMLMIGIAFELNLNKEQTAKIVKTIIIRYAAATVFAILFYLYLPLPINMLLTV